MRADGLALRGPTPNDPNRLVWIRVLTAESVQILPYGVPSFPLIEFLKAEGVLALLRLAGRVGTNASVGE